jgi:hypothetical protein
MKGGGADAKRREGRLTKTGSVDDRSTLVESLGGIFRVVAHSNDGVLVE